MTTARIALATLCVLGLAACAQTSVQPLSRTSFKVDTTAAPACGPAGARNVAFRTAAIEVIRRGEDLFVIEGDQSGYDGWSGIHAQGMVVQVVSPGSARARDALSARRTLGPGWEEMVAEGTPITCT
ncbi:hypothetical protein JQC91_00480 [Jannaschia sp. Os4]|uniref:hypothetical protein n=1 Tax=Jannaschia sp. Os4 TaxID=2807617 RepID=UPI00193A4EA3|nr:hypothetical protein [Jannaschia sp. Os4]MBM2574766.1 hypothetical protein [Jannaschia sp. Os4]